MKKAWKITLISILSFFLISTSVCVVCGIFFNSFFDKKGIKNEKKLTKEIVHNLVINGAWKDKTFINADDLKEFQVLENNCFDDIPHQFEYVELPENIKFNQEKESIIWENVNEIRIQKESEKLFILNDLLLYQDHLATIRALTISNRVKNIERLRFPTENELNAKLDSFNAQHNTISVNINFYNDKIFKNVKLISLSSDDMTQCSSIRFFQDYSFSNCQKLEETIRFLCQDSIVLGFGVKSFFNTNIKIFECVGYSTQTEKNNISNNIITFAKDSFSSNKNLTSFKLENNGYVIFDSYAFKDNSSLTNIIMTKQKQIMIGSNCFSCSSNIILDRNIHIDGWNRLIIHNNAFSAKYERFSFYCQKNIFSTFNFYSQSFSNIECNIDFFNFEVVSFNKEELSNVGLSVEQYNKVVVH